jgi:hypothetical protein
MLNGRSLWLYHAALAKAQSSVSVLISLPSIVGLADDKPARTKFGSGPSCLVVINKDQNFNFGAVVRS